MSYNSHSGAKQRPLAVAEAVTAENCIYISFLDVKARAFSPFRCPAVYFKAKAQTLKFTSVIWGRVGHSSVTPVNFFIEMHFEPYVLQNWNLTKSFQSISLKWWAELLRLRCTGCVYYCGLSIFLIQWVFFLVWAAELRPTLPGFHQACSTMLFLPGCSSLSLTSPLNYCVCAHGSVTLNPGFILLSDRRHRRHVCHRDIWQAATLSAGKCNYSNEIKEEMGYLLSFQASTGINISVYVANTLFGGLVCSLRLAAAYF